MRILESKGSRMYMCPDYNLPLMRLATLQLYVRIRTYSYVSTCNSSPDIGRYIKFLIGDLNMCKVYEFS